MATSTHWCEFSRVATSACPCFLISDLLSAPQSVDHYMGTPAWCAPERGIRSAMVDWCVITERCVYMHAHTLWDTFVHATHVPIRIGAVNGCQRRYTQWQHQHWCLHGGNDHSFIGTTREILWPPRASVNDGIHPILSVPCSV